MKHRIVIAFLLVVAASLAFDSGANSASDQIENNSPSQTATPISTLISLSVSSPTATSLPSATPTFTPTPAPTLRPTPRSIRVPMLMYHYVSVSPSDADIFRLDLSVTPQAFEEQMAYLVSTGYQTVRVADVVAHLTKGAPLPAKSIVLTFDDGYVDIYQTVLPILKKYRMTATFYVIAQFTEDKKAGYVTWEQLREMTNAGMEIGSHSLDHLDLRNRTSGFLTNQLTGSRQLLESRLGIPVKTFSYPAGKYDARTIAVVRSSGYLGAVTEIQGVQQSTSEPYELRRVRVRGSYAIADYAYWLNWYMQSGR